MSNKRELIDASGGRLLHASRHMVDSVTRLYSIKVKDAETGAALNFTAADWSGDDKRLAVTEKRLAKAIISRLTAQRPTPNAQRPTPNAPRHLASPSPSVAKPDTAVRTFVLEQLIRVLHDNDIYVVVQTSNAGLMLTISDRLHRVRAEHLIERPTRRDTDWPGLGAAAHQGVGVVSSQRICPPFDP